MLFEEKDMYKLNLETKTKEQELIKEYLENNVSDIVADKINNGVKITKDNKTLINKKDLTGFMKFATDEAKKQAEKGSTSACIVDKVVLGWAMHYFEEDSIEGNLYNEDGTEYKVVKITPKPTTTVKTGPKKETSKQSTLFDLFNQPQEETIEEVKEEDEEPDPLFDDEVEEKIPEIVEKTQNMQEKCEKTAKINEIYEKYHEQELNYPDIVVLIRVGDFYEAYNENAERIADILDLVLTSKDVGLEHKVKLAGFPYHVKDSYFKRINEKYNILVMENDELNFIKQEEQIDENTETPAFDKHTLKTIASLLDGKMILK